ncbi:hypothetical protein GALL_446300 [mine drainage metagenome]|uniref:Antitoxin VbhA domain-containing protein n=1 Tax=mine drainage metagenome TaxID=410659 RepID=A0A1J5PSE2_9ZZZZ
MHQEAIWRLTPEQHRAIVVAQVEADTGRPRDEAEVLVSKAQTEAQWAEAVKQALRAGRRIDPATLDRMIAILGDGYVFRDPVAA